MEATSRQESIGLDPSLSQREAAITEDQPLPLSSQPTSIPISRPITNLIPSASAGAVPTKAALQAAGILPPKVGEPSRSPSPPIPTSSSTNRKENEISSPLPFSTSVPYSRTNFNENIQGLMNSRPLSSDEVKSLSSFSKAQSLSITKNQDRDQQTGEVVGVGSHNNSIPSEALFPSPSGGFVPPPEVDGVEWKLKDAPKTLARGGPIEGESLVEGVGNDGNVKEGSQTDKSQTPRNSTIYQTTSRESLPPTRPPSLPASSQTAELIATAPSSSTSNASASRRASQASPLLRPISTNSLNYSSLSLSRSGSNDKRRKSGLSTTSSSNLSPTENFGNSKRQSFNLNNDGTSTTTMSPVGETSASSFSMGLGSSSSSRPSSISRRASKSPPREKTKDQPQPLSSETKMNERPSSSSSTAVGVDRSNPASPTSENPMLKKDSTRNSTFSSTSLNQDQSNPTSSRHSNLSSTILPPLKIRDFAFPETDPRHVGARDLSIPEERLSTGYGVGGTHSGLGGGGEDEEEWGPEAHEHSYEDDEEEEEGVGGGLPEGLYQVIYPFQAESEHELTVTQDQKVQVVGGLDGGWAIVQKISEEDQIALDGDGNRGLVPEAYLEWLGPV